MRNNIKNITDSFKECKFDMETILTNWIIYFWDDNFKFFFELPNEIDKENTKSKAKIFSNNEWLHFEDDNIDVLIYKIKEIYGK